MILRSLRRYEFASLSQSIQYGTFNFCINTIFCKPRYYKRVLEASPREWTLRAITKMLLNRHVQGMDQSVQHILRESRHTWVYRHTWVNLALLWIHRRNTEQSRIDTKKNEIFQVKSKMITWFILSNAKIKSLPCFSLYHSGSFRLCFRQRKSFRVDWLADGNSF